MRSWSRASPGRRKRSPARVPAGACGVTRSTNGLPLSGPQHPRPAGRSLRSPPPCRALVRRARSLRWSAARRADPQAADTGRHSPSHRAAAPSRARLASTPSRTPANPSDRTGAGREQRSSRVACSRSSMTAPPVCLKPIARRSVDGTTNAIVARRVEPRGAQDLRSIPYSEKRSNRLRPLLPTRPETTVRPRSQATAAGSKAQPDHDEPRADWLVRAGDGAGVRRSTDDRRRAVV